ncbi:hypothetical protein ISN45_Aa02g015480 [Arabidopsis thaliana x Arabidopsis arenosa]|uniref:Uncharacterized protein n=1 Tax=Arabidopsis thaliana x Arabidopsis arenosa TaxID=1240361 RepID=A0A8T2BJ05_9BRAS|nr:hypothetical protein ISN45_Aa02g015480 [Arabidopsis thaliana x Arabidopsis arenosa]
MWMATQSNSGFESLNSMMSRHAINFQSNTSSEMISMSPYLGMSMINVASPGLVQTGNSSNASDSVSGLMLDTSMVSEWSNEEQYILDDGLAKYKDIPSIERYIQIGNSLPDKSVRDIALRCMWMTRKRRKSEELNCGRRTSSTKEKQVESSSKSSIPSVLPHNMASYPFSVPSTSTSKQITSEDLSGHAINLLEQNVRAFSQIRANLSSYKVEDNVDLFRQARNNLITIQNDMNNMPGLMNQMPPLPVTINDDLSVMPFNTMQSGGFHTKQKT